MKVAVSSVQPVTTSSSPRVALENELADKIGPWVTVIRGLIFVGCVLVFRRGLVGELLALRGHKAAQPGH